jgi:hypothetical protein
MGASAAQFEAMNPGYHVYVRSGHREGADPHGHNVALDMRIFDPQGKEIHPYGKDVSGKYVELARISLAQQQARHPELARQFGWGGFFNKAGRGTADPYSGSAADLEHYDLEGAATRRTALTKQFHDLGPLAPPKPRTDVAAAAPGALKADTLAAADTLRKTIDEKSKRSVKVEGSGKVDIKIAEPPAPKGETEKHFFKPNPVEHKAQMEPARTGPETHPPATHSGGPQGTFA